MRTKFLHTLAFLSITCIAGSSLHGQTSKFCNPLPPNLSQHLVAYYPFCGNANDKSGNNNNPIYNNATLIKDRFGNANSAYSFDRRSRQYIQGDCSNYPVNQRTVSVWFKVDDSTICNEILGYGGGVCGSSFFIGINTANVLLTYDVSGHCGVNGCRDTAVVPDRTWSNFVVVNGKKNTKLYLNGVLIKTFEGITFKNTSVTGKDFAFGSIPAADGYAPYKDGNVNFLDGSLDDIVIYDSAINDAGVMQLYQYFKTDPTAKPSVVFDQSGLQLTDVSSSASLTALPNPSNGAITDYSETLKTYQAAVKTAEESGNKARMASFYTRIGNAYLGQTNYTEALKNYQAAIKNYQAAIKIWEELGNKGEIASAYFSIGTIYNQQGNYTEAISNRQTGVKIAEETGDKALLALLYNDFGVMYANHGNGPEALKNFLAGLKFFEETGDKSGVVLGYNNTGAIYMEQGNYPEALKKFLAALKISEQINDQRMIAFSHTNLGELYSKQGNYQEALNNYRVALKIWPDEEAIGECYANIGTTYYYLGNYSEALKNHLASQKIALETEYKSLIADSYINIGLVYVKLNKYPEAKQYLINGLALSKEIGARWKIKDAYDGLSKLDSAMGEYQQALKHYKLYTDYKDSLLNETNVKQIAQMREQYESEKKDKQIELLNKGKAIQELQLKKQKQAKNYFIAGLVLVAILGFFVYRNYHNRQKLKLLALRNKIASDLHDDVGSTLSSISIFSQIAQQQSNETIPMLETIGESSRKMLDAMADIVWTIKPENDLFEKIIMRMRNFAYELLGARKIDFEFIADKEVAKINLPMEVRKNLYLIFKEATNNLVKYAQADKAMFAIRGEKNNLTMIIRDNGKGFDMNSLSEGNGLNNMRKRAEEIGGQLSIDSCPGNGTTIQLKVAV